MRAQAQADLPIVMHTNADMPVIGITQDGTVSLNEHTVNLGRLIDEINRTFAKASAVYVRADERASWASVSKVIATLNSAKISIRLVSK
jgi:biopolymer transport protein ExbD